MMEHNTPGTTETVVVVVPFISGEAQSEFLEGELVFNPSDPYAVSMNLEARSGTVTWTFARELLEQGIYSPSGDGDVQVWPCLSGSGDAVVIIELCSPDGEALVQAKTGDLSSFVDRMSKAVELGNESAHLNVDAAIEAIFAAEAA